MPAERVRRKKNRWKYNIVLLPHEDAGKSWSFRIALWGLVASLTLYAILVGTLTVVLLKWTPLGVWIPVKNPELERRYGREVTALQEQLSRIVADVVVLQRYNAKLRQALGSDLTGGGGSSVANAQQNTDAEKIQQAAIGQGNVQEPPYATDETLSHAASAIDARQALAMPTSSRDLFRQTLPMRLPVNGYTTRGFEPARGHLGIDIAGKQGSPILAAADGYILFAGWTYDAGYMMIIAHGNGYFTFYKHNQSLLKAANTFVKHGEPIALLGNTGAMSHGPHLHFEVWKDGVARDPSEYVLNFHLY